jgi:hypothetical protein
MGALEERFAGRTLGVVTRHGKEAAIAPAFLAALPLRAVVPVDAFDTDVLGTFSGERPREAGPLETAGRKAREGAAAGGLDLVIASEGSFGPYPPAPFLTCDEEVLALYDARDDRLFTHRHVSLDTRAGGEHATTIDAVRAFAGRMGFPGHGLVLRPAEQVAQGDRIVKGIQDPGQLVREAERFIAGHGGVWVETDLRAMMNPTRMAVITETAERFVRELATPCPACGAVHFRVTGTVIGLLCAWCGTPTEGVRALVRSCWRCGHSEERTRDDGRTTADPQHCPACNP